MIYLYHKCKLIMIAIAFFSNLLAILSYVYKIENQIYTKIDVVGNDNENKFNSYEVVPIYSVPIYSVPIYSIPIEQQQMYKDLDYIYEHTSSNPESYKFNSALFELKHLYSSIEYTIQSTGTQIQSYISIANPFNYALANVIGKLLIPENNQLLIKKLLFDKFYNTINFNREKLKININHITTELNKEIEEIQKTINELNDPNIIKRANNYIQNVLIYFVSPHAVLTTGKIKLDKMINILSKIEYIKKDFNVSIKRLLSDSKMIVDEYGNQLYNNIVVIYYLGGLLITFGGFFIYEIQKPDENKTIDNKNK